MRLALLMLAALALAGCASHMPERVEVPIPVPCKVQLPEKPVWATESLPPSADIYEKVRALLAERRQRMAYETKLEAAAQACQ